jgi:hypothetical protein
MIIFEKNYDYESLYKNFIDLGREIEESIDESYNPSMGELIKNSPSDCVHGTFTVTIEWDRRTP